MSKIWALSAADNLLATVRLEPLRLSWVLLCCQRLTVRAETPKISQALCLRAPSAHAALIRSIAILRSAAPVNLPRAPPD